MAKDASSDKEKTNIRRIKATDNKKPQKTPSNKATAPDEVANDTKQKPSAKPKKDKAVTSTKPKNNPFRQMIDYFKGSWYELKQVHWPSRSATWSMTVAVLLFSLFFVVLIVLLDSGFRWVFEQLLR